MSNSRKIDVTSQTGNPDSHVESKHGWANGLIIMQEGVQERHPRPAGGDNRAYTCIDPTPALGISAGRQRITT